MIGDIRVGHLWLVAGLLVGSLAMSSVARAQVPIKGYPTATDAFDPREVALLPKYCIYSQSLRPVVKGGDDPEAVAAWYAYMGPPFHHVHHYCVGLMKMNRALLLARDTTTKNFYLADAIREIDYVIDRADDTFVLMPEMRTKKGECLVLLGRGPEGVVEFERAIAVKRDYWPPYAQKSDFFKAMNDPQKAREALEEGLAQMPDAPGLKRRLAELGGPASRNGAKR